MTLRRLIPSTQSLFAFEAAARTLNFTDAGRDLNVTQPAVSKSIAALEQHLGCRLFQRSKSGLSLTSEGEVLNSAVRLSFPALENALRQITRETQEGPKVHLSLSTAFVTHWLMPQLEELKRDLPELLLGFTLDIGEMRGPVAPADLGLRHQAEVDANEISVPMAPEWVIAVASPEYLERNGTLDAPKPGASHSLVKLNSPRITWSQFLQRTGQQIGEDLPVLRVPDYSIVVQQALNGKGVALGFATAIGHLMKEGQLLPALPVSWQTGYHYALTQPVASENRPDVARLAEWISNRCNEQLTYLERKLDVIR